MKFPVFNLTYNARPYRQMKLEQSPFSGHGFVFRGRRGGDLMKVLWWDGDGLFEPFR